MSQGTGVPTKRCEQCGAVSPFECLQLRLAGQSCAFPYTRSGGFVPGGYQPPVAVFPDFYCGPLGVSYETVTNQLDEGQRARTRSAMLRLLRDLSDYRDAEDVGLSLVEAFRRLYRRMIFEPKLPWPWKDKP